MQRKKLPIMPRMRYILALLLAGGILSMVTGCPGSGKKRAHPVAPPMSSVPDAPKPAYAEYTDYRLSFPDQPPHVWEADVSRGQVDEKTGTSLMHKLTCRMYRQGHEVMQATADEGKAEKQGKIAVITLFGHVVATEPKYHMRVRSDSLHWVSNEDNFTATTVHADGRGYEQWSDTGIFSLDLTQATMSGHLRVESIDKK